MLTLRKWHFRHRPFLWALLFLSVGISLTEYFRTPVVAIYLLWTGVLLFPLSFLLRRIIGSPWPIVLRGANIAILLMAVGAVSTQLTRNNLTNIPQDLTEKSDLLVIGNPEKRQDKVRMKVQLHSDKRTLSYLLYIKGTEGDLPIQRGDRLQIRHAYIRTTAEWEEAAPSMGRYLASKGLYGTIHTTPPRIIIQSKEKQRFSIKQYALDLSDKLAHTLKNLTPDLPPSQRSMIETMCLGRYGYDTDMRERFTAAGVVHILAVSGFHVGIILGTIALLFRFLPIPQRWKRSEWIFMLVGGWGYAFICGLGTPVIRAMLMATLFILGKILHRPTDGLNIWATAAFITLLINPLSFYDIGFLLSYTAVFSILIFFRPLLLLLPDVRQPILNLCYRIICLCVAAQVFTLPLVAHYFGQVEFISLWINLPITLIVSVLIPIVLLYMLAASWGISISILGHGITFLAEKTDALVRQAALIAPHATYDWQPSMPAVLCLISVLLVAGILWRANLRQSE